jgi:KDEL-tailed cysteine endopeptidase
MEGAYFLKTGKLQMLSEQQLVDCDRKQDQGCNGGLMDNAFDFIQSNKGLTTEKAYPYKGVDGTCKKKVKNVAGTTVKKHTDVASNEKALMSALTKQPVSIAIEADQQGFQFYKSGVFTAACGTALDHGVLAVGFGTMGKAPVGGNSTAPSRKKKAKAYWKVKNSWGATWGMNGYILLERGTKQKGGQCGILNGPPSYPTL